MMQFSFKVNRSTVLIILMLIFILLIIHNLSSTKLINEANRLRDFNSLKIIIFTVILVLFIHHKISVFSFKLLSPFQSIQNDKLKTFNNLILILAVFTSALDIYQARPIHSNLIIFIVYFLMDNVNEFWLGKEVIIYKCFLIQKNKINSYKISPEAKKALFIYYNEVSLELEKKVIKMKISNDKVKYIQEFLAD